jgi:hypothetical protein
MACTPVLDEAIHQNGVKVGVGNTILLQNTGVSRDTGNKKKTAASWVFEFAAHTLPATYWLVALIGPRVSFT